jgi:hypothetical protein
MGLLYGRAGRLTAKNGGFRPGQWVSFVPRVSSPATGWSISSMGQMLDPVDVVAHGATHLHAMGADGAMVYSGPDGKLTIASLDVPVLSTGILSPFPTPGDNSSIASTLIQGMHWNVQNNVWNVGHWAHPSPVK